MIISSQQVCSISKRFFSVNNSLISFIGVGDLTNTVNGLSLWLNVYSSTAYSRCVRNSFLVECWQEYYIYNYNRFISFAFEVANEWFFFLYTNLCFLNIFSFC